MRLNKKGVYGLIALVDIAKHANLGAVKVVDVCERQKIPTAFLRKLFLDFKDKNIIKAQRGPGGGYVLAKEPENISVYEVLQVLGEEMSYEKAFKSDEKSEEFLKISSIFSDLSLNIERSLKALSLSDIIKLSIHDNNNEE